ncbi:MAG: hypothetical protein ABIL58_00080 [Pseudomonadota bacterium]
MSKERIDQIRQRVQNPAFISGIHNYCDRWCQRCPLTARCTVFAMELAEAGAKDDGTAEDFWGHLTDILASAAEMLHEWAETAGIDLTDVGIDDVDRRSGDDHILVISARKYSDQVGGWFDAHSQLLAGLQDGHGAGSASYLQPVSNAPAAASAADFIDIILWYHTLIVAKLHRAVLPDPLESIEDMEDLPRDADGSAKVALIAIDRSLAAWIGLNALFPQVKPEIEGFVAHLGKLRRSVQWAFPNARTFVRPGFDDETVVSAPGGVTSQIT